MDDAKLKLAENIIKLEKEKMNDAAQMNRAHDAELFYKKHFKNFLALKEYEWLRSMGLKDWTKDPIEHAVFHQGALECLEEIRKWFEDQTTLSLSRFEKEEKPEPGEVIPPIET